MVIFKVNSESFIFPTGKALATTFWRDSRKMHRLKTAAIIKHQLLAPKKDARIVYSYQ